MIEVIPSLSVIGGKCVRLSQGDYNAKTVYDDSPLEFAKRFEEHGIRRLHLIDLDGARQGEVVNYDVLQLITEHTGLAVDFGGGIQNDGDLAKCFEYGAQMVNIGSIATTNRDIFAEWLISYGRSKIILSADSNQGIIAVRGRQTTTSIDLMEFVEYFYEKSLMYLKCSDVASDGMMQGPALSLYSQLMERFPTLRILASGGVASMDDVKRLEDIGVYGVIVGKAFYEGKITLEDLEAHNARQ